MGALYKASEVQHIQGQEDGDGAVVSILVYQEDGNGAVVSTLVYSDNVKTYDLAQDSKYSQHSISF